MAHWPSVPHVARCRYPHETTHPASRPACAAAGPGGALQPEEPAGWVRAPLQAGGAAAVAALRHTCRTHRSRCLLHSRLTRNAPASMRESSTSPQPPPPPSCRRSLFAGAGALTASARAAKADDAAGVASSRMSYSRFLEYLEMGRVKKVGGMLPAGWWVLAAGRWPAGSRRRGR